MAPVIGAEAQAIIDRLAVVNRVAPVIDRTRAQQAFADHFRALGLTPLPVRWVDDTAAGLSAAGSAAESAAGSAAWSAARSAAESAAWSAAWSAAESAAWSAAWSAARSAARSAAWSAARSAAWSAARSAAWSAAWSAIRPTVEAIQASALELIDQMVALTPAEALP